MDTWSGQGVCLQTGFCFQGSQKVPTSHLGQADFPVEQVTFHVHLDRGPKVISQLSHKRGKQKQACTSLGQAKFESSLSKGQAQIKFFFSCVFTTTVPVTRKSSWHPFWDTCKCNITKAHNHDKKPMQSAYLCAEYNGLWMPTVAVNSGSLSLDHILGISPDKNQWLQKTKRLYSDYQIILYKKEWRDISHKYAVF